ncbi:hypothetical protein TRVL_06608 [Trypanosoma vivax]|nr:hypothetical protein TRVL_06608 [Trypanosoma vivax]
MGSLFKLRDHWYTRSTDEQFSHVNALTVGNVDNHPSGENKIAFGSFSGTLRIMKPMKKGAAQPEDTLVEKEFGEPILQIACRPLDVVGETEAKNLLVVLFPKRLVLLRAACGKESGEVREGVEGTEAAANGEAVKEEETVGEAEVEGGGEAEGDGDKGEGEGAMEEEEKIGKGSDALNVSCYVTVHREFVLENSLYNFVCGKFGHAHHEMVCVQSMNGQLTIIDRSAIVLRVSLPSKHFLLPGCLAYCPQRDYLLTNNSCMMLMCFSFSTLTNAYESVESVAAMDEDEGATWGTEKEAMVPTWTFPLGDDAVAIEVCRHTRQAAGDDEDIVVLCPHSLFVVKLNGSMRYTRRLDVTGVCLATYFVPSANASNILIGTVTGSVLVLSDTALEWSAKMVSGSPMCLEVAEMLGVRGLIVSLNTEGAVSVNYLGTDPEEEPIQPLESKESDYAEMVQELRTVQQSITQFASGKVPVASSVKRESMLHITWSAPKLEKSPSGKVAVATVSIQNESESLAATDIRVLIHVVEPVEVDNNEFELEDLPIHGATKVAFQFSTTNNRDRVMPSSLEARAVVLYTTGNSRNHSVSSTVRLPFILFARPAPPVKISNFALQLDTDQANPPSLLDVFSDMSQSKHISANMVTFEYLNGADVTLLVSKNASRFRLQASTMEALWPLAEEVQQRLYTYYGPRVQFSMPEPIPLDDFLQVIDTHMAVRAELVEAKKNVALASQVFLAVQKRLLMIFRERNPVSSDAMETLLDECYRNLQKCTDAVSRSIPRQKQADAMLSCCAKLILMHVLVNRRNTLTNDTDVTLLQNLFFCAVGTNADMGWEEVTDEALGHLLTDSGVEVVNEGNVVSADHMTDGNAAVSVDLHRLKKRLSTLLDALMSGSIKTFVKDV